MTSLPGLAVRAAALLAARPGSDPGLSTALVVDALALASRSADSDPPQPSVEPVPLRIAISDGPAGDALAEAFGAVLASPSFVVVQSENGVRVTVDRQIADSHLLLVAESGVPHSLSGDGASVPAIRDEPGAAALRAPGVAALTGPNPPAAAVVVCLRGGRTPFDLEATAGWLRPGLGPALGLGSPVPVCCVAPGPAAGALRALSRPGISDLGRMGADVDWVGSGFPLLMDQVVVPAVAGAATAVPDLVARRLVSALQETRLSHRAEAVSRGWPLSSTGDPGFAGRPAEGYAAAGEAEVQELWDHLTAVTASALIRRAVRSLRRETIPRATSEGVS